ncbi:hypothetical protein B0H11DRAFT_122278 [Mycena galericulata]|nr:hypothetical protein B0H11DRAFT_122278 [Mycena galericulata]
MESDPGTTSDSALRTRYLRESGFRTDLPLGVAALGLHPGDHDTVYHTLLLGNTDAADTAAWTEPAGHSLARPQRGLGYHLGPWFEIHWNFASFISQTVSPGVRPELWEVSKLWAEWDVLTSLANYHSVVKVLLGYVEGKGSCIIPSMFLVSSCPLAGGPKGLKSCCSGYIGPTIPRFIVGS